LNAMRKSITDMGEPWGIPLNRGKFLDSVFPAGVGNAHVPI